MSVITQSAFAAHAGDGAKIFRIETESKADIFDEDGGMITVKNYIEISEHGGEEFCAGVYLYNDSLTNGDCVEMQIIIVEYTENRGVFELDAIHLKDVHACPGDNGKFAYTDPLIVDSSKIVKAMIWGKEKQIPYGKSSGYLN